MAMTPAAAKRTAAWRDYLDMTDPSRQGLTAHLQRLHQLGALHVADTIIAVDSIDQVADAFGQNILTAIATTGCPAEWGVCPEHGDTLIGGRSRCRCRAPGCDRAWEYDRLDMACGYPITWDITNPDSSAGGGLCDGHTIGAREQIPDATFTPHHYEDQEETP